MGMKSPPGRSLNTAGDSEDNITLWTRNRRVPGGHTIRELAPRDARSPRRHPALMVYIL